MGQRDGRLPRVRPHAIRQAREERAARMGGPPAELAPGSCPDGCGWPGPLLRPLADPSAGVCPNCGGVSS